MTRMTTMVSCASAFYAAIEPYKAIACVAIARDAVTARARANAASDDASSSTSSPSACAKCVGMASTNAYLTRVETRGVVMMRQGKGFPIRGVARACVARDGRVPIGGVLFVTTANAFGDARAVTMEDVEPIARAMREANEELRDVPFGFYSGADRRGGGEDEDEDEWRDAPRASVIAAKRLRAFLESSQKGLNTFG